MDRQEIMEKVAEYFRINPERDDNGNYDIKDYEWISGCYINGNSWLSLGAVVRCIEAIIG